MSLPNTISGPLCTPHICGSCALPLVQPEDCSPEGRSWRVLLRCPSCGFETEELLDRDALDRLDEELDRGQAELALALRHLTHVNMSEYADQFTAALAAGAILPEDF